MGFGNIILYLQKFDVLNLFGAERYVKSQLSPLAITTGRNILFLLDSLLTKGKGIRCKWNLAIKA